MSRCRKRHGESPTSFDQPMVINKYSLSRMQFLNHDDYTFDLPSHKLLISCAVPAWVPFLLNGPQIQPTNKSTNKQTNGQTKNHLVISILVMLLFLIVDTYFQVYNYCSFALEIEFLMTFLASIFNSNFWHYENCQQGGISQIISRLIFLVLQSKWMVS